MTAYLVRHGSTDLLHTICGRTPGVHLSVEGQRQAQRIARRLAVEGIHRIVSSPMERTRETAQPLAERLGVELEISDAFNELDFGEWTGRSLSDLESDERWRRWNAFRSGSCIPNGETMIQVQARMVEGLAQLHRESPDETIAIFSHGDPIRTVLIYFLGIPLDLIQRIEIAPAHASILVLDGCHAQVRRLNCG
jgi:broad specificity phosphatase PhoE